jgi:hypothetical protein
MHILIYLSHTPKLILLPHTHILNSFLISPKLRTTSTSGDKELIEGRDASQKALDVHNASVQAALERRKNSQPPLEGDKELILKNGTSKEHFDKLADRVSDTLWICRLCMNKNRVTYIKAAKAKNGVHKKGYQKGQPCIGQARGTASCWRCNKKHVHWAVVETSEETLVKNDEIPLRIQSLPRPREVCNQPGCTNFRYENKSLYMACKKHYAEGNRAKVI